MTKLDAINIMLAIAGESPVNSLNSSGLEDVTLALSILDETNRLVQSRGWNFNLEFNYEITPDSNQNILLPSNAMKVSVARDKGYEDKRFVVRGNKLYDRVKHTYQFNTANNNLPSTGSFFFDFIFCLEFDELPQEARYYVTIKAARDFEKRSVGDDSKRGYTQEKEMEALVAMQNMDSYMDDYNIIYGNPFAASILRRV